MHILFYIYVVEFSVVIVYQTNVRTYKQAYIREKIDFCSYNDVVNDGDFIVV